MTPKEKAEEFISRMVDTYNITSDFCYYSTAKQCALIAVDEIINYLTTSLDVQTSLIAVNYWEDVKQEIENL